MPRPGCGVELSTRSGGADLPPGVVPPGGTPPKPTELLRAEADLDTWRIVEVFSRTGLPFDVDVGWSSGSGSGAQALVTIARAARICVFARSLWVVASNLSDKVNRVGLTVADGFAVTRNQWEHRGALDENVAQAVPIPPFAETLRVELAELAAFAGTVVEILDGAGLLRATHPAALQPQGGIGTGGAGTVRVRSEFEPTRFRVVFHLSL